MVWVKLLEHFLSLFPHCECSHFSTSIYRQWVHIVNVVIFQPEYIDSGCTLVSATALTVLY